MAVESLKLLAHSGVSVAVARRKDKHENSDTATEKYKDLFTENGLPEATHLVAFAERASSEITPEISENYIRTYHTPESCSRFMCAYSRMLVKNRERSEYMLVPWLMTTLHTIWAMP